MNDKQRAALNKHFDRYFGQECHAVMSAEESTLLPVRILLYQPNEQFPFWKLVTVGASDYKLPAKVPPFTRFNEYMMFVSADVDLTQSEEFSWYANLLMITAQYPAEEKTVFSYCHSLEMQEVFEEYEGEMCAITVLLPEAIPDLNVLFCKTGLFKKVTCLQIMPITRKELQYKLRCNDVRAFNELFYPADDSQEKHFLAEKKRSFTLNIPEE